MLRFFLALALLALGARADVRVVDSAGGGSFTQISAAVAAASDGDVILVKSGVYFAFTVNDKSLDIVADASATAILRGPVRVLNLAAVRTLTLSGFGIEGSGPGSLALELSSCSGAVRVQSCTVHGFTRPPCVGFDLPGTDAVVISGCSDVAFAACTLIGGGGVDVAGYNNAGNGARAVVSSGSSLAFYDCTLEGGVGGGENSSCPYAGQCCTYGGDGGDGAVIVSAPRLYLSNTTVRGGAAGTVSFPSGYGGCGGSGLVLTSTNASATASTFLPGAGVWFCLSPHQGVVLNGATLQMLPGTARRLVAPRVVREGQAASIVAFGRPGDQVRLVFAEAARFAVSPAWIGVSLVRRRPPEPVQLLGTIGASGALGEVWIVPDQGAGIGARRLLLQAELVDASGIKTMSTPATLVLLDSSY